MRTLFVIFVMALIAIAFEIYSDPGPTIANVSHTVTSGIAHGLKRD